MEWLDGHIGLKSWWMSVRLKDELYNFFLNWILNLRIFFWRQFKKDANFLPLIARIIKSMAKWDNGKRRVIIFMHEVAMTKINWCKEGFN